MLTPEREKEIRELNKNTLRCFDYSPDDLCQEVVDVKELLAEIDRLRAQAAEREKTNQMLTGELIQSEQNLAIAVEALEYRWKLFCDLKI